MWKYRVVAIDYDGTLVEDVHPRTNGKLNSGTKEFVDWLKEQGWEIIIYTCRPSNERKALEENLESQKLKFDYICFYSKPVASLYIDDKGFRFNGSWREIKEFIKDQDTFDRGVTEDRFYRGC